MKTIVHMDDKNKETTKEPAEVKIASTGAITFGIVMGLFLLIFSQSAFFAFVNVDAKTRCLNNGGVFTEGRTIMSITYTSCTYTK